MFKRQVDLLEKSVGQAFRWSNEINLVSNEVTAAEWGNFTGDLLERKRSKRKINQIDVTQIVYQNTRTD